jgi:radial spoke head protein 9
MEADSLPDHLKFLNCNGITLSVDERLNLMLSLTKLQNDQNFEELLFWGKITGEKFT